MRSELIKVLHPVCGRPMIEHVINALRGAGVGRIVLVVGHQRERVRAAFPAGVEFAVQEEQLGTGHAVLQAEPLLAEHDGPVVVTLGDMPLLQSESLHNLLALHRRSGAGATVLTAVVEDPSGYGRILRDESGRFADAVEERDAAPDQRAVREVNTGTYAFEPALLFTALRRTSPQNAQGEHYLPDVLALLARDGHKIELHRLEDAEEAMGVNDRVQLAEAEAALRRRILERWMRSGVSVIDPAATYVEPTVTIGPDTVLHPGAVLRGAARVGRRCVIGPYAVVDGAEVGDEAVIENATVIGASVAPGERVGPYACLKPERGTDGTG